MVLSPSMVLSLSFVMTMFCWSSHYIADGVDAVIQEVESLMLLDPFYKEWHEVNMVNWVAIAVEGVFKE